MQQYFVDIIKQCVDKSEAVLLSRMQMIDESITGLHYLYGHPVEIKKRLIAKSEGDVSKFQKYPIVALIGDFVEDTLQDGNVNAKLQILIGHHSNATEYNEDRYTKTIKPLLNPIYNEILKQLWSMPQIVKGYNVVPKHQKIDRPHWGNPAQYGNDAYIFGDCLDAIEIRQLDLTIDAFYCNKNTNKIL